jgi:hypothetical protein
MVALATCLFSSCGLLPPIGGGVGSLSGKVQDGIYTSPDGKLSVKVPQTDHYELSWMEAKEITSPDSYYVSFGPAAFDKSIYRCSISTKPGVMTVSMQEACHRLVDQGREQVQSTTNTPLELQEERATTIDGKDAYAMRLSQHAPKGTVANVDATIRHEVCLVQHTDRIVFTWVQTYDGWPAKGIGADAFLRSVVVH